MKILILAPYPKGIAPSQRFRFEQYLNALNKNAIEYDYIPFIDFKTWNILHKPGMFLGKAFGMMKAFAKRFWLMFFLRQYDFIFIHREASHIGPPVFEFIISQILGKKIIYDFDDAIWLPNYSVHNKAFNKLKWYSKVKSILSWSYKASAGNEYLKNFALNYCPDVLVNPTTIDTLHHHNQIKNQETEKIIIGWTGTLTTIKYLEDLLPVISKLEKEHDFEFKIICNENPNFPLKSFVFKKWEKDTEIDDLLTFNVGLMPLKDDIWAQGKCGFKALQYMALGIPALVSPVGVNSKIVDQSVNGFICKQEEDWYNYLEKLILDSPLRNELGKMARKKIEQEFSVDSNTNNFLSLFK